VKTSEVQRAVVVRNQSSCRGRSWREDRRGEEVKRPKARFRWLMHACEVQEYPTTLPPHTPGGRTKGGPRKNWGRNSKSRLWLWTLYSSTDAIDSGQGGSGRPKHGKSRKSFPSSPTSQTAPICARCLLPFGGLRNPSLPFLRWPSCKRTTLLSHADVILLVQVGRLFPAPGQI
jgi:hypothetical protein